MHHALIAAFATAVVVSMASIERFELVAALGVYPSLIASNCLVLSAMQEIADRNGIVPTMTQVGRDVLWVGVFFCLFGLLREFVAYGAVLTDLQLVAGAYVTGSTPSAGPIPFMAGAPGALLMLALCLAGMNAIVRRRGEPDVAYKVSEQDRRPAGSYPIRVSSTR